MRAEDQELIKQAVRGYLSEWEGALGSKRVERLKQLLEGSELRLDDFTKDRIEAEFGEQVEKELQHYASKIAKNCLRRVLDKVLRR